MENKLLEKTKVFYFMAFSVIMYYFVNEYFDFGIHITYRHVFALVLFFSATVLFLYKPNVARGFTAFKQAFVYSLPLFVSIVVSLFIWFVEKADITVISRGFSGYVIYANMFSAALAACAILYIFGQKGIWYNLLAILIANILIIFTIIAQYGIGNYFSELITLITTFAGVTGDIIIQAEVHELAFCLGAYLIYMLYKPKKNAVFYILLFLTLFCFLSAFKRIAMIAIAIALVFGYLLKFIAKFHKKTASGIITILTIVVIGMLIAYIALIKMGAFEFLEQAGINTSGRVDVYKAVDKFYEFRPSFIGNGMGFLTYKLNSGMNVGVAAVHNDFLQYFIDLGFWGYIIWLVSMTLIRVWHFGKNGDIDSGIITFMLVIYLIIVSTTDNTISYPLLTCVLAILMMGNSFDDKVRAAENKIFGYVSDANKKGKEGLLL